MAIKNKSFKFWSGLSMRITLKTVHRTFYRVGTVVGHQSYDTDTESRINKPDSHRVSNAIILEVPVL